MNDLESIVRTKLQRELMEMRGGQGELSKLKDLIAKGWQATYSELFGQEFVDSLDSEETDDKHHSEAIEWHWKSRIDLLENRIPDYYAYFPIWARGNLKSSLAEAMVVIDAVLTVAYGQKGYCLYIGREKDRVKENIGNIEALLSRRKIREYCPELSEVAKNEETNSKRQWTGTFLHTKAGYIIKGGTVESSQAGSRIKFLGDENERDTRVTFFVPDDIDSREDSPVIAETRFRLLTTEILPMKQENTLTFFAQNLISRYSVMYRIQKGGAKVLTNRKPTEPVPAVRGLVTEQKTVNGIVKDVVVAGCPTWRVWNLLRVQNEIDTMGLESFLREMQHEVDQSKEGIIIYNYDDNVHPVSYSQFASIYGSQAAWKDWYKIIANDYARTKTKYHANVGAYLAVSNQNTKLPGHTFIIPMTFAANTAPEDMADRFLSMLQPYAYGETTWKMLINEAWKRLNPNQHFESVTERLNYLKSFYSQIIPKYSKPVLSGYHVRAGVISHSEDKLREGLNTGFGFGFQPSNPGKNDAIEDINSAFKVDYSEPHCFDVNKKGYTRTHVLCADDLTKEPMIINGIAVYPPVPYKDELQPENLHDSDLFRYQMLNCRNREPKLTESGEMVDEPLKILDDFKQMLQMVWFKNLLSNIRLTDVEKFEINLQAKGLTVEAIESTELEADRLALVQAKMIEVRAFANSQSKHSSMRRVGVVRRR